MLARSLAPCTAVLPQVYWTREASEAISTAGSKGLLAFADKCTMELNKIVNLVGSPSLRLLRVPPPCSRLMPWPGLAGWLAAAVKCTTASTFVCD